MADFLPLALRDFLLAGEKAAPPVFVGRETILADIIAAAELSWRTPHHVLPGATRVLQGAPGAGKSAILTELRKRSLQPSIDGTPKPWRVVEFAPHDLQTDLPGSVLALAAAGGLPSARWRDLTAQLTAGASIGVAEVRGALGWTKPETPQTLNGLKTVFTGKKWKAHVIVAIDEAQRFIPEPISNHAMFLQAIHDSKLGLPLTLVLAGLGTTDERARKMDLTRGKQLHPIGALSAREALECMTCFCIHFGMDPAPVAGDIAYLTEPCEGWPHHLHCAMAAIGEAALGTGGDLAALDWSAVGQEAAERRRSHYQRQQSNELFGARALVAAVMKEFHPSHYLTDIINGIDRLAGSCPGKEWQLPKGFDAEALADHLIHQGILHTDVDKRLSCPIPSFRSYLMKVGEVAGSPQGQV